MLNRINSVLLLAGLVLPGLATGATDWAEVDRAIRMRDYSLAVNQLQPLVRQKDAEAQYRMAGLYRSGKGVNRDLDKAVDLYRLAAEQNHGLSQYALASLLEKNEVFDQAEFWYQEAANQDVANAKKKLDRLRDRIARSQRGDQAQQNIIRSVLNNDQEQIESLIEREVDLNFIDRNGRNPLMLAARAGHSELARMLVPATQNLKQSDNQGSQALHYAATQGMLGVVRMLLERGVSTDSQDGLGNTALIIAVRHDDAKMTDLLLLRKADYRKTNRRSNSALDIARVRDHSPTRAVFFRHGIKLNQAGLAQNQSMNLSEFEKNIRKSSSIYKNWPVLNIASLLGEMAIVNQLLAKSVDINATDDQGHTALHRAASKGQVAIVKKLLKAGAVIDARNERGQTALYLSAQAGQKQSVELLLAENADSSVLSKNQTSALSAAITGQHPEIAGVLAGYPLDIAARFKALKAAILQDMEPVSLSLIATRPGLAILDDNKRSLLWHSADRGQRTIVKALLDSNTVKIGQRDRHGYDALARAALNGYLGIVQDLNRKGASLDSLTEEKNTMLMLSVLSGNIEMTRWMIDKKLPLNAHNQAGDTALMMAAAAGKNDLVSLLIESGANLQTRNADDLNAYQIAQNAGHGETAELIREKSGRLFRLFN